MKLPLPLASAELAAMDLALGALDFGPAREFHENRPAYDTYVFESMVGEMSLEWHTSVLDVGAGTGRASIPIARRGARVDCLEPDTNMAAVLERNGQGYHVNVIPRRFEEFDSHGHRYDLVVCAEAWHLLDSSMRFKKAHDLLKPGGRLLVVYNENRPVERSLTRQRMDEIYSRYAPELVSSREGLIWLLNHDCWMKRALSSMLVGEQSTCHS